MTLSQRRVNREPDRRHSIFNRRRDIPPTFGENVSIVRHQNAGENIPGATIFESNVYVALGIDLGGDYWNSAYPIGVVGEYFFGTGDVRPTPTTPWNFNPVGSGVGKADVALDSLTFEMVSTSIALNSNSADESSRFVSFLIGGNPGRSNLVTVSVEMAPSCDRAPTTVSGVDVYYGYRGAYESIATRIANHNPDLTAAQGTPAMIAPWAGTTGLGDERMSLVVIDLWGRDAKSGGNPRAGWCGNGRIRVRDLDPGGHLNVDEIVVGNLKDLAAAAGATPFGARAYSRTGDNPTAIYGYADIHTHWMSHLGAGAEPVPSVTDPASRRSLRALTAAMGAMAGRPYQPSNVPAADICPSNTSCAALTSGPLAATWCVGGSCALSDAERDRLALAMCDGDGGGSGKHQNRGGKWFGDTHYRSDSAASQLLTGLDAHSGSGECGTWGNDCSHNSWGFDYANQRFQLPARPFMSRIHQQMYWKWLKRAWQGGLRLIVTDVVHSLPLDLLMNNLWAIPNPDSKGAGPVEVLVGHATDEQYALQRQVCAVRKLLSSSSNGGPGASELNGWATIVTTPAEARRAIGAGKLAVVLGAKLDTTGSLRAKGILDGVGGRGRAPAQAGHPQDHAGPSDGQHARRRGAVRRLPGDRERRAQYRGQYDGRRKLQHLGQLHPANLDGE